MKQLEVELMSSYGSAFSLILSRHYMKQLPMFGTSHIRRIIPFFFPEHLDALFQQFKRVPPFASGYIDCEAASESFARKQVQGLDQRLARLLS